MTPQQTNQITNVPAPVYTPNYHVVFCYLKDGGQLAPVKIKTMECRETRTIELTSIDTDGIPRENFADILVDIGEHDYFRRGYERSEWKEFTGLFETKIQ